MAAHQQVGDFTATNVNGTIVKQGGNVASYFCTPGGRVIHAVIGPVNADELLKEANWALAAWEKAKELRGLELQERQMSLAHQSELPNSLRAQPTPNLSSLNIPIPATAWGSLARLTGTQPQKVHQLLAERPLAPLEEVYVEVFERILGERVSKSAPNVELAEQGLQHAGNESRPMLFILHQDQDNARFAEQWLALVRSQERANPALVTLLRKCVVIVLPHKELPALSSRLKQEPYSVPTLGTPLFIITNPKGKQLDSLAGYQAMSQLSLPLAKALVAEIKLAPPQDLRKLKETAAFMKRIDPALAAELQPVIEEVTANQKKVRIARSEPSRESP